MDVCHCTVNGEGPTEAVGERKDAGTNFPVRRSLGTRCAPAGTAPLTVHSAHAAEAPARAACVRVNPASIHHFPSSCGTRIHLHPGVPAHLAVLAVFSSTCASAALPDC